MVSQQPIVVDGTIDPVEWAGAPVVTELINRNPIEGSIPSQRTEVRVLYTSSHLYVGYSCFDTEPDKIVARVGSRDSWRLQTDMAHLDIDPYHDHRTAYHFSVGAANIQTEAMGTDVTWDGVWKSATRITDEGWFVEMAIPFSILRFEPSGDQTMGINFARKIQRTKEEMEWTGWRRDEFMRPDVYGHLSGLRDLRSTHDLEVMPYTRARGDRFYRSSGLPLGYINETRSDFGVDLKYGITSNMALDVALNPDFGQIAPDAEQINVTRYERYFRELRPFFVEGQSIFRTPMQIFYSRRIGKQVSGGVEANLLAGSKLTGRTGPYQIGLISALTERKDYTVDVGGIPTGRTEPMAHYSIVRVERDILARSSFGILMASKDIRSGAGKQPYQRSVGMDLNLSTGRNYYLTAMVSRSINPGDSGNDWGAELRLGQRTDLLEYGMEFHYLGPEFDVNQVGYITQVDRRRVQWNLGWKPRPEKNQIRRIELKTTGLASRNFAGQYTAGRYGLEFRLQTMNYMVFDLKTDLNDTRWRDVYAPDPWATPVTARFYRNHGYSLTLSTDTALDYSFNMTTSWGNFLDYGDGYWGRDRSIKAGVTFRPSSRFQGSADITHIREYYRDGTLDETKNLLVLRASHYFTPNLSVKIYNQFRFFTDTDPGSRNTGVNTMNLVISYFLNAKSVLYIVYNEIRDDRIAGGSYYDQYGSLPVSDRVLLTKLTYWFSF